MYVLVACEFSGVVREAFRKRGHAAWSCDLLPAEDGSPFHYQGDVFDFLPHFKWDLMIAHPPCTHLACSGARWFNGKAIEQAEAYHFFMALVKAPIERIAIENPIGIMSTQYRKPNQIVQPYFFGDSYKKSTCLWLKNLPLLVPTKMVGAGEFHVTKSGKKLPAWYNLPPSEDRGKIRSRTFQGFANAMAKQWG
jgi:hypothetical protein